MHDQQFNRIAAEPSSLGMHCGTLAGSRDSKEHAWQAKDYLERKTQTRCSQTFGAQERKTQTR